jgi:hypothetical protein
LDKPLSKYSVGVGLEIGVDDGVGFGVDDGVGFGVDDGVGVLVGVDDGHGKHKLLPGRNMFSWQQNPGSQR